MSGPGPESATGSGDPGGVRRRLPELVEERLRHGILSREFPPGSRLPPERKLAELLGVNRSSVREAIRRLESQQLVRSRQGDGTRVLDFMDGGHLDLLPALLLTDGRVDGLLLEDVLEVRSQIGCLMARLAATRHTEEERLVLGQLVDRMAAADPTGFPRLDIELFQQLGRMGRNLVLRLLINALAEPYLSHPLLLRPLTAQPAALLEQARRLLDALAARDPARAEQAAQTYLEVGRTMLERLLGLSRRDAVAASAPEPPAP